MLSRAKPLGVHGATALAVLTALAATAAPPRAWGQEVVAEPPAQSPAQPPPEQPPPEQTPPPQQSPAQPPTIEAEPPPSTITLDRMDSATRASVQVGLISVDPIDGWFMRANASGQYVARNRGSGFYGQFPIAHFFNRAGPDATAVGAVEVGAFLLPRQNSQLVLRFGAAIATGYEGAGALATHLFSATERLTDFLLTAPRYSLLRMSASTVQQWGAVFFRGDFGFDVVIAAPNSASALHLRANAAVGLRTTPGDLTIELVNFGATDTGVGASNSLFHTLTFGIRTRGTHQAHAGLVFPLDASLRGDVWILSLGYHYAR